LQKTGALTAVRFPGSAKLHPFGGIWSIYMYFQNGDNAVLPAMFEKRNRFAFSTKP